MNILNLLEKKKIIKEFYPGDTIKLKIKFDIKKNKFFELNNYKIISIKKKKFIKIYKKIDNIIVKRNIIIDSPYINDLKKIKK